MAYFIHSQAENILSMLKECPTYQGRMEYTVMSLKAVLFDAVEKQEQNDNLRTWLRELQNVFNQIEDSINEFKLEFFRQEGIRKQVRVPFLCSDRMPAHKSELTRKRKKLCDHLDAIAAKMYEFHLTEKHTASIRMATTDSFFSATEFSMRLLRPSWQLLYPLTGVPKAYHDRRNQNYMPNEFNKGSHKLLHIVGDAGMGKSTLAKFIYNDKAAVQNYTLRLWVCVQEDFDTHRLLKEVHSFADDKKICDDLTNKQLLHKVQRFLEDQTFLLIFQDLSITNLDHDSLLQELLSMGNPGSKIIVTTQSEKIADSEGPERDYIAEEQLKQISGKISGHESAPTNSDQAICKLERLSDEKSLSLFKYYAFGETQEVKNSKLIKMADPIVQKCNGVPLNSEPTKMADPIVQKCNGVPLNSELTKMADPIVEKCNGVPLNSELTKMADTIVQKCNGVPLAIKCVGSLLSSKTRIAEWKIVEDKLSAQKAEADSILPTLRVCYNQMPSYLKQCFLYCSQLPNDRILSSNDVIQLWMAHGLLHSPKENSLTMENIGEQYFMELWSRCFVHDIEDHGFGYWFKLHPLIQKLAHILTQEQSEGSVGPKKVTEIRSIAFPVRNVVAPSASLTEKCISKFKCLRLLYLGNTNLEEIPNAIGKLKNLRYLDLQGNKKIKRLPDSICDLQSLQTLILASCSELEELPNDVRNLISLRYLSVTANKLHLHKNGVGTMTSLRFLAIGGCDNLRNLFERPECLACLEILVIYKCQALKSLPKEMRFLKSLQNLVIWRCKELTLTLKEVEFRLQRFTIRELPKVEKLPEWLEGSKESLRILQIINCPVKMDEEMFTPYEAVECTVIYGAVRFTPALPGYGFQHQNKSVRAEAVQSEMKRRPYY